MALPKLTSRGTYEEINSGAHRTAASIVGIPSLVRNLGIWDVRLDKLSRAAETPEVETPIQAEDETEADRNASRRKEYCDYIEKLKELISEGSGHLAEEASGLPSRTYDQPDSGAATLLRFRWHGMLTTIRLEYHTEYVVLTSIIDLSIEPKGKCAGKLPDCPYFQVNAKIEAFNALFEGRRKGQRLEHKEISDYLQLAIWEMFEREVIDARRDGTPILSCRFGEVFLDSRGIVTGTRSFVAKRKAGHLLREPFVLPKPRSRMREGMMHDASEPGWASDAVRRIWPFIECERELAEFEYTVTGFLKGRVLFVTALGPQPVRNLTGHGTGGEPIRYFLHARPDDEWQLGRLVDRINALGTMRLAATMEISELRIASGRMDDLVERIEKTADAIQSALKAKREGADGKESSTEIDLATKQMGKIREGYAEINKDLTIDIWHRLERSQYYFQQFQKECGGLREQRVEGFQTYSEFVTRRMNSIFGYIAFLGTRMESIDSANSSLERQFASLKIASVTENIQNVVERLTEQDSEIAKIQEFGEFALIGVLIPYYVGSVIEHTFELDEKNMRLSWIIVITICIFICLIRLWLQRAKIETSDQNEEIKQDARKRLGWVKRIFVIYLAVVITVSIMAIGHQPPNLIGLAETLTLLVVFAASLILAAGLDLYAIPALAGHLGDDSAGREPSAGTESADRKPAVGADGGT